MYIDRIEIKNIRSISSFTMTFPKHPGWHVVIGDNGSGKSTVIRSIALALIGPGDAIALRQSWDDWLMKDQESGFIELNIKKDKYDQSSSNIKPSSITNLLEILKIHNTTYLLSELSILKNYNTISAHSGTESWKKQFDQLKIAFKNNWNNNNKGWFSVAYGPFRRFTGGSIEWKKIFDSNPKVGAHLSAFGEDVALTEALEWLKELDYARLKNKESGKNENTEGDLFEALSNFINHSDLLPHGAVFAGLKADGPVFIDGNGNEVLINQMSDGYRSILSMIFELIRQLVRVYGSELVFKDYYKSGSAKISLPGVVLIDEIDAHLHPTWQTRIGQWFTKYFPNLQFIVTTHSPLICRAAEHGSIWRLSAPGSSIPSGEITGVEKERLVFGNVLDAYGTEVFGKNVTRSQGSSELLNRLAELNMLHTIGKITDKETAEMESLRKIFTTDDTTEF